MASVNSIENLIYLPLDIPDFTVDRDQILNWHDQNRSSEFQDSRIRQIGFPWLISTPRSEKHPQQDGQIPGSGWQKSFADEFPQIVENVERHLPFSHISTISILEQLKEVAAHQDISREVDLSTEPAAYRCTLVNEQPESTFFVRRGSKQRPSENTEDIFPEMPDQCRWWAMNNYCCMHGSYQPKPGNRKILFSIWGKIDRKRHWELLERSWKKYSEYAICFENEKPSEIHFGRL